MVVGRGVFVGRGVGVDDVGTTDGVDVGAVVTLGDPVAELATGGCGDREMLTVRDGLGSAIDRETLGRLAPPSQDAATITANSSHRTRGRLDREITTGPSRAFPVHHADSPVDGVAHDTQGCWPQGLPGVTIPGDARPRSPDEGVI